MIMVSKIVKICLMLTIVSVFLAGSVCALINTIPPGGTVFIGEQGLDVSGPIGVGATEIGWWASGASITGSSPDATISVPNPANFDISPNAFTGYTGSWYNVSTKTPAFVVATPQLDIRVEDATVGVDVTNKWVSTDDQIRFIIDTNLVTISQRGAGNPITIKVQSPNGGVYTSLINDAGTSTSIVDYQVTTTPKSTGTIWGTGVGNRTSYPQGTYTIWAESYVNSQSLNTPLCTSSKVSLLNQDRNPLIVDTGYVTNPTTQIIPVPSTTITTIATTVSTTLATPLPTTAVPTVLPMTTAVTIMPTTFPPTPTHTKSPGFEASIGVIALIFGSILFYKKQ
jgi:hypothetical protein